MYVRVDQCVVIFEPAIVEPFINPPDDAMAMPQEVVDAFYSNPQTVAEFVRSIRNKTGEEKDAALLRARLANLNTMVGQYSIYRDVAVYQHVRSTF